MFPLFAVIVFASCRKDEAEVIPRSTLADIYAEMLMTDQWISSTPGVRMIADTSLVYEPILEKYGYDKLDYVRSVDHYMDDPERFARILRSSAERIDRHIKELRKQQKRLEREEEKRKRVLKHQTDYSFDEYFPYLADEPYVHYYDSVTFRPDSMKVYRLIPIETADTLYDRIEMIIPKDSLELADSVAVTDSIELKKPAAKESPKILEKPRVGRELAPAKIDTAARHTIRDRRKR